VIIMPKKKTSLIRSPDFKTVYAVGAIGTWTPYDFRINFYSEKVMEEDEESYLNDAQIILSPKATKEFALWLMQNISDYEAAYGKSKSKDESETKDFDDTKFRTDLRSELKADIKSEVQEDIQKYLVGDFKNRLTKDFKEELKTDLRKYFKQNLQNDIKREIKVPTYELKKDLKKVLKADLKQDLREDIKKDIKKDIKEEIRRDLHVVSPGTMKLRTKAKSMDDLKTASKDKIIKKMDAKKKKR